MIEAITAAELQAADSAVRARLCGALPRVLKSGLESPGPTSELLDTVSAMLAPRTAMIEAGERLFDPLTAPDAALPWLSSWFGWGWLFVAEDDPRRPLSMEQAFPPGPERLRSLLTAWPVLQRSRGRPEGLALTLELATGLHGIRLEQDLARQHLSVRAPVLPSGWLPWLRRVIAGARPVHLTWDLIEDAQEAPS